MNSLSKLLGSIWPEEMSKIPLEQHKELLCVVMGYLLRYYTSAEHTQALYEVLGVTQGIARFRQLLTNDGYTIKNLKLFLAHPDKQKAATWIHPEDRKLGTLIQSDEVLQGYLDETMGELLEAFPAWTPKHVDAYIARYYERFATYTRKYVIRKMTFIVHSECIDVEDLVSQLLWSGFRGMLMTYPHIYGISHLHALVKRSIHNAGINLIHYHSNSGRCRYLQDSKGAYSARVISLDALRAASLNYGEALGSKENDGQEGRRKVEIGMDISHLRGALSSRKSRFAFDLLRGRKHVGFSDWLLHSGYEMDNRSLASVLPFPDYLQLVSSYIKVEPAVVMRTFRKLIA